MSATLSLYSLTLASGDATANNNPNLRFVDWKRQLAGIPVKNPKTEALQIQPGVEQLVFDGTRSTTIDGTTALDLTLSALSATKYRLTHSGGTAPGFRTDRGLNLTGIALTLTANANGSLTVLATTGTPFTGVQVGDEVMIPGVLTGDADGPFNPINEGLWSVLGASGTSLTLVRPAGTDFQGMSQSATPSAASQFLAYSAAGVQVGDKLEISAGFAAPVLKTYEVTAVTSKWVEIGSTSPLAPQAGVTPGASGIQFFSSCKRFVRVEADQECAIRANGDTGSSQRVSPWVAGDPEQIGEYVKVGPTWSLRVLNRSSVTLNVTVISAE